MGALVGGVGGFVGAAFHLGVNYATNVRMTHPWVLYLLPLGGVIIVITAAALVVRRQNFRAARWMLAVMLVAAPLLLYWS